VFDSLVLRALVVAAMAPFHASSAPLSPTLRAELKTSGEWHQGCPVGRSQLRLLRVTCHGFDGRSDSGTLVVNRVAVAPLTVVFRKLYALHFPLRHLDAQGVYGPPAAIIRDGDPSGSFECRQAVPSPCVGGTGTGSWSMHAFGLAVDLNPRENPYVGCGEAHDPASIRYRDRARHRKGMVTANVVRAFASVGWGWGGAWPGDTKDYMHFSATGH